MPINKSVEICVIDGNMSDDYYSMNYTQSQHMPFNDDYKL